MKTALVVSGGGCKGAYAIGAIEYTLEQNINFDILVGTSTGALITPMVAADEFEAIKNIYINIRTKDLIKPYCWLTLPWRAGYYNVKGLRKTIDSLLTDVVYEKLVKSEKVSLACVVNLSTGASELWSPRNVVSREAYVDVLLASCNQPGIMPPVKMHNMYYVDGGVREIAPIQAAIELGATRIIAIVLSPVDPVYKNDEFDRIPKILLRTLNLMTDEIVENDITAVKSMKDIDLTVIRPESVLAENDLEFIPEKMRGMLELGYNKAKGVILLDA